MSMKSTDKEASRSFVGDGREFTLNYQLSSLTQEGKRLITALSVEKSPTNMNSETSCSVQISNLSPETILELFMLITGAEDPVFPVHLPDIVRDHIRGMDYYDVCPTGETLAKCARG